MFLKKFQVTSNASRNVVKQQIKINILSLKLKNFYRKFSQAGRNNTGRLVCRRKSSLSYKLKTPFINYTPRTSLTFFVISLKLIPYSNKLTALVYSLNGGTSFLQLNENWQMFSFIYNKTKKPFSSKLFPNPTYYFIYQLKNNLKISLLELIPGRGAQYARSSGTRAHLVKVDMVSHTALVKLPSGVRKIFSIYSLIMIGSVALRNKKLLRDTRSGYWRKFGVNSRTRGVACNPHDHPHGGRTKAIKYPRTPWGKTTKFK